MRKDLVKRLLRNINQIELRVVQSTEILVKKRKLTVSEQRLLESFVDLASAIGSFLEDEAYL